MTDQHGNEQRKRKQKRIFRCLECNQLWIDTGRAAHGASMCSSECLTARVGRKTVVELREDANG